MTYTSNQRQEEALQIQTIWLVTPTRDFYCSLLVIRICHGYTDLLHTTLILHERRHSNQIKMQEDWIINLLMKHGSYYYQMIGYS